MLKMREPGTMTVRRKMGPVGRLGHHGHPPPDQVQGNRLEGLEVLLWSIVTTMISREPVQRAKFKDTSINLSRLMCFLKLRPCQF